MSAYTLKDLQSNTIKPGVKEAANFVNDLFNSTQRQYLKYHKDWYISERFFRGEHWIVYNKTTNKVQTIPTLKGEVRRTINKIKTQIRGVKNLIKRNQPRWEVGPDGVTDDDLKTAQDKNDIIQHVYETKKFPSLLTDVIVNGLKYSAGILEGGIVKNGSKEEIDFWINDTFDVYFDPLATSVQDCRFIFKVCSKPISAIRANKNYTLPKDGVKADNKEAASQYKELLQNDKFLKDGGTGGSDLETAIVKELWVKWIDEQGNFKITVYTVVGTDLVRVFNPSYRRYPIFLYNPEKEANSIFSQAWLKDLISPNKSLDKTVSQIESYIQRMLAGKYLIKQGVEVSSITDKGAEMIYYKGSTPPVQQNLQPLPAAPFNYADSLERWIEEMGGMREASLGRAPSSLQSGKGIEALQAADASTVSEPTENLEIFLQEIGEFVLELISDYTLASEEIIHNGKKIKYIGGTASNVPEGTTVIKPGKVKVRIVPEIAYSEEAKKDLLMKLVEMQVVDPQTLLEKLSISNVGEIIKRVNYLKEEQYKQEMMKQQESHRTEGEMPTDSASLADQENMKLASKAPVQMTPKALWTPEHFQLHIAFIKENKDAYAQNQQNFDSHIRAEEGYAQQK